MTVKKLLAQKEAGVIIALILLFALSSALSSRYAPAIAAFLAVSPVQGELIYMLVMAAAVVIAPFETLPLLPLAAALFGPLAAALYSIAGWSAGSLLAFLLARLYGRRFVCRIMNKCDLDDWGRLLPRKQIFWLVAFARFFLPIDIISYAVAIFTRMSVSAYFAATMLGIIPFAFILAYGSLLALEIQGAVAAVLIALLLFKYRQIKNWVRGQFEKYRNGL